MQASLAPFALSLLEKKIIQDLTFLLLVSKICITAASLYSALHLTNEQSVSNVQNLFKTEYKQNELNRHTRILWGNGQVYCAPVSASSANYFLIQISINVNSTNNHD